MEENAILVQILQTLNTFQAETTKAINDLREEVKENKIEIQKSREIEEAHWQENLRLWKENDKRWEENNKRWEENDKRWEENNKRWEENDKRWEENNKRWEENNKRWEENKQLWEENNKRWEENKQLWQEYRNNRIIDRKDLLDILTKYDISISEQLKDKNVEKMKKLIKNTI
jgi:hypothetical protein